MARVGQMRYKVDGLNTSDDTDITNGNIIANKTITKLGIQAPPGTMLSINNKPILIGRTGIYELDDDITIDSLQFNYDTANLRNIIIDFVEEGS